MTTILLRTITGAVHEISLEVPVHVHQLYAKAAQVLKLPEDGFKLVQKGTTITNSSAAAAAREAGTTAPNSSNINSSGGSGFLGARQRQSAVVHLSAGDVLLVVPQRKAPSERLQRAAAEAAGVDLQDEDDAALRFSLRPGAPAWEVWLARFLQEKCNAPELLLIWLFQLGPARLLLAALVMVGARIVYNIDPGFSAVYLLVAMIAAIYINLGTKKEGEASAYSVFNPGVQRLPGQLDADEIDRQIRRGQM